MIPTFPPLQSFRLSKKPSLFYHYMMAMILFLFSLMAIPKWAFSDVQLVTSGPETLRPGQNLNLVCKVTGVAIAARGNDWDWIRQPPGRGLEWVGRVYPYDGSKYYASSLRSRATISADSSKNQVSLQLNSVTAADSAVYFCTRDTDITVAGALFYYWGKGTMVTVTSVSPATPSLFPLMLPSESIPSNGLTTIGCLAKDVVPPVISFTWDNQNVSINANNIKKFPSVFNPAGTFTYSSQVTISANDWWNFQPFYCMANNTNGTGVAQVIRPTSCFKPDMIIRGPRLEDFENSDRNATIVCMTVNLRTARATVQWLKNGHMLNSDFATTGPAVMGRNGYSIVSELTVDRRDWVSEKTFSCEVHSENFTSIKNISKPLICDLGPCSDVQVRVETIPPAFTDIFMTKSAKLTCRVSNIPYDLGLKELQVTWTREHDNTQLETIIGQATAQEDNTLVFVDATATVCPEEWDTGDTFKCKVTFPSLLPTAETRTLQKLKGSTYYAPEVYVLPPPSEQLVLQETATVTCMLKGFYPSDFFVKWLWNGEPVADSEYFVSQPIRESESPERYFTYSMLNVKEHDWNVGTAYTCVVGHEALPLQTTQKTVDKKTGKPTLVNVSLVLSETTNACY